MIIGKIQNLSMFQIEHLQIPFNQQEEELIATIPSHVRLSSIEEKDEDFLIFRQIHRCSTMNSINVSAII